MLAIQEFADGLSSIPEDRFTHRGVLDYLQQNKVRLASLEPYTYFSPEHYTRNLIHRTPLFELIAICWDSGQKSAIHNHRDQRCWMAIAYGRLQVAHCSTAGVGRGS
jgi:predicted metal-dependent enzyme (double-stranded beta helix superfamily)